MCRLLNFEGITGHNDFVIYRTRAEQDPPNEEMEAAGQPPHEEEGGGIRGEVPGAEDEE
jgi:hypothetical protein